MGQQLVAGVRDRRVAQGVVGRQRVDLSTRHHTLELLAGVGQPNGLHVECAGVAGGQVVELR